MTTQHHQMIHYCRYCELEYMGGHCAPCPLCPLREACSEANDELHAANAYLVIEHADIDAFEYALNGLTVMGWISEHIKIAYSEDRDQGDLRYIAVLRRRAYDPERHAKADAAKDDAEVAYREQRQAIEAEAKAFIAARAEGA